MINDFGHFGLDYNLFKPTHMPHVLLKSMIEWSLYTQRKDSRKELKKMYNAKSWLKEFCTIKFCLPRQSGHSTSALKLANHFSNDPWFIVYKNYNGSLFQKERNVFEHSNFEREIISRPNTNFLVVDNASLLSKTKIEEIYNIKFNMIDTTIILFLQ